MTVGQQYKWSVDVKCSRAITIKSMGHEMGGVKSNVAVTTSWQTITYTFTATTNANNYHSFIFYSTGNWKVGDVFSYKNLSIQKVSGMKADNAIGNLTVTYDGTYASLPTPTKTGYTFAGWYLDSGLTKPVTTSTKVITAKDHTLYSKWVVNQYRTDANTFVNETKYTNDNSFLKYDVKVDGVVAYTNIGDYCKDVNYGSVVEFYNFKVQAGYKFTSYYSTPTNILNSGSSLTSVKITVGANDNNYINFVLSSNIYALTLDRQSGSGGTASIYMKYAVGFYSNSGASISITGITKPTRAGFTFQGYYTDTSGKGTQIIDESGKIVGANNYIAANDTLYAYWTANNPAYYDEEGGYWYVEMGMFPQTLVKDTTTINALNKASNNSKTYSIAGQTLVTRSYNNDEYCLYNNNWYKVEPVRWRLQGTYTSGQGFENTNVTAVLAEIVYASAWADVELGIGEGYSNSLIDDITFYEDSLLHEWSSGVTDFIDVTNKKVEQFTEKGVQEVNYTHEPDFFASSIEEIELVCGKNANMEMSDLVKAITNNSIKYWTRNLGSTLNTAKTMTTLGMVSQDAMQNVLGVQYTINITEFGCINS